MNPSAIDALRTCRQRTRRIGTFAAGIGIFAVAMWSGYALAQAPPAPEPATQGQAEAAPEPADAGPLAPLAWLEGCWKGTVNQREFREQWLPLRGGMLIGAGQSVLRGKMQDYEYLRLEARDDGGVLFSQFGGDLKVSSFRLAGTTTDGKDTIFTFTNTAETYPAKLTYRRGAGGWLYETIEGSLHGSDKTVIYPLRRIDCESGELILK